MKIYDVKLKNTKGTVVYSSLVPELHVQEKIATLLNMNDIANVGGIFIEEKGDISDRYIQTYIHSRSPIKEEP